MRFLLVGGVNTVVAYAAFALLQLLVGHIIGYLGSLYGSYAVAVPLAFVLHRRFTFQAHGSGSVTRDFLRFSGVYVLSLAVNTVLLPALVELAHFHPLAGQAVSVVVATVISYVGHKYFSFRRKGATG